MRTRLPALVGFALTLALPAGAQQMNCDGPQDACQAIAELGNKYVSAENNNDAASIAALYTSDGVIVPEGPIISGRDAIEKFYSNIFKAVKVSNMAASAEQLHINGNLGWAVGSFVLTQTGSNDAKRTEHGNYGAVYTGEGGTWKVRMLTVNLIETPPTQAAPSASASR
ncbi:MAG TPA: SgcJ/EcaC family oxidoreductase [Acetobacteraceae bacterium]|nr:SgcJ/EcaC family oxidoreductase [Acetobacteraceae bacterium]